MHTKIINVYTLTEAGSGVVVISLGNKCYRKDTGGYRDTEFVTDHSAFISTGRFLRLVCKYSQKKSV